MTVSRRSFLGLFGKQVAAVAIAGSVAEPVAAEPVATEMQKVEQCPRCLGVEGEIVSLGKHESDHGPGRLVACTLCQNMSDSDAAFYREHASELRERLTFGEGLRSRVSVRSYRPDADTPGDRITSDAKPRYDRIPRMDE